MTLKMLQDCQMDYQTEDSQEDFKNVLSQLIITSSPSTTLISQSASTSTFQNESLKEPAITPIIAQRISKEEIEETYELLRDFGINIKKSSIPRNISIFDLHMWRKKKIKEYLFS